MINTTNGLLEVDPRDTFSKYLFHIIMGMLWSTQPMDYVRSLSLYFQPFGPYTYTKIYEYPHETLKSCEV